MFISNQANQKQTNFFQIKQIKKANIIFKIKAIQKQFFVFIANA